MWGLFILALTTGVVAAFNPCGFAMLPAYLGFFVSREAEDETNVFRNLMRGLGVGLSVTLGFVAVFGALGFLTQQFDRINLGDFATRTPWITVGAGVLMVLVGAGMLGGWEPKLNLPRLNRGGKTKGFGSMFMFGISYAVVSLSCTAPIFLSTVIGAFSREGQASGIVALLAYAVGMGLVIITLTMAASLARMEVATLFRRALPYVNRVSGGIVGAVGLFMAFYGWWEIQVFRGNYETNWMVDQGERLQSSITNWLDDVEGGRLSVVLILLIGLSLLLALRNRLNPATFAGGLGLVGLGWLAGEYWSHNLGRKISDRFELFARPMFRTFVALPGRIGNWFTEPLRWATLGEVVFTLLLAGVAWLILLHRRRSVDEPISDPIDEPDERLEVVAGLDPLHG